MRKMLLAALGVLAVAGAASAQQPVPSIPVRMPSVPVTAPTVSPAAAAATPLVPASGATVIRGDGGCANCGSSTGRGFVMSGISNVTGGNCQLGYPCQNGCGSIKSDLAFHFGSCKNFFAPCGPTCSSLSGHKCPTLPFAAPWGQGWQCPRAYDSYTNH
ncbi:MAG: hypothetical protein J0I06_26380 [Planctomycetes bacterium]|nr:hypothetical protein [Planctomycetota bacterium]